MRCHVTFEFQAGAALDDLDAYTDRLADALHELPDVIDPDLGANLKTSRIDITMTMDAETVDEGLQKALTGVRAAIQSAAVTAPGRAQQIRLVAARARESADT